MPFDSLTSHILVPPRIPSQTSRYVYHLGGIGVLFVQALPRVSSRFPRVSAAVRGSPLPFVFANLNSLPPPTPPPRTPCFASLWVALDFVRLAPSARFLGNFPRSKRGIRTHYAVYPQPRSPRSSRPMDSAFLRGKLCLVHTLHLSVLHLRLDSLLGSAHPSDSVLLCKLMFIRSLSILLRHPLLSPFAPRAPMHPWLL